MKFYDCATAPSPRRVRIFLAEKGITVPLVPINLRAGEQLGAAFRAINPDCTVPVLELDNGVRIADAVAICAYFEERQPDPPLMGADAEAKAIVIAAQRWVERDGFYAVMEAFRNATPGLKGRALPGPHDYEQIPALADRGRMRVQRFFSAMEERLSKTEFVAGHRFSIADITALVTVDFAGWIKLTMPEGCANLRRWHQAMTLRHSAKA
jgi:glutathione S-transferase